MTAAQGEHDAEMGLASRRPDRMDEDARVVRWTDDGWEGVRALLMRELPERRYERTAYVRWLYEENPLGRAHAASALERGDTIAHYACVPVDYRRGASVRRFVFSLHAVTDRRAQGRGWFSRLGEEVYAQAEAAGAAGVIGVSNANSTPPVVKRLGFRLLGPLPVRVVPPLPRFSRRRAWYGEAVTAPAEAAGLLERRGAFTPHGTSGWDHYWTVSTLTWRLSAPDCGPYVVHVGDDLAVVSLSVRLAGPTRASVILKVFPLGARAGVVDAGPAIDYVRRWHRAVFSVYAGFNRRVLVRGVQPPRRLQPSPLNLIYRSLDPNLPDTAFRLDTFEFLDMDAY
ncbi:MAG: hypothetical protein KatS3mg008_0207 [Acidimicrobiales bacterium]|nr:MAG: hypothetical protein KatS3mg008_0207 [Acidimicrobiales bacterium]